MKLLVDENLSPKLPRVLRDIFPESVHVREVGLKEADDEAIWRYAIERGFAIVSKDADFHHLSFVRGHPPKVIAVCLGNCSAARIEQLLRSERAAIERFNQEEMASFKIVGE